MTTPSKRRIALDLAPDAGDRCGEFCPMMYDRDFGLCGAGFHPFLPYERPEHSSCDKDRESWMRPEACKRAEDAFAATERIVAAAVKYRDMTFTLPAPARHHNVIHAMSRAGWTDRFEEMPDGHGEEGFLTSSGRFVGRAEARRIAVAAGQLLERAQTRSSWLYSEDVW